MVSIDRITRFDANVDANRNLVAPNSSMDDAKSLLVDLIQPTRQLVALAKAHILAPEVPAKFDGDPESQRFARTQASEVVDPVFVHPTVDTTGAVESAARYWSCVLAFHQALLELDGEGLAVSYQQKHLVSLSQRYSINVSGNGQSGSWSLDEFDHIQTRQVIKPEWASGKDRGVTADGDVFALHSGLSDAHPEIQQAAVDAIECLRRGLFRPAAAMLGKVAEGAWIEAGLSLTAHVPDPRATSLRDQLNDQYASFAKKVSAVADVYRGAESSEIRTRTGIRVPELGSVRTQRSPQIPFDLNTPSIPVFKLTARSLESTIFR